MKQHKVNVFECLKLPIGAVAAVSNIVGWKRPCQQNLATSSQWVRARLCGEAGKLTDNFDINISPFAN